VGFSSVETDPPTRLKLTQIDSLDGLTLGGDLNAQTVSNWLEIDILQQ